MIASTLARASDKARYAVFIEVLSIHRFAKFPTDLRPMNPGAAEEVGWFGSEVPIERNLWMGVSQGGR